MDLELITNSRQTAFAAGIHSFITDDGISDRDAKEFEKRGIELLIDKYGNLRRASRTISNDAPIMR